MGDLVYLSGGIHGLTFEQASGWRNLATLTLEKSGLRVLDPVRRVKPGDDGYFLDSLYSDTEIVLKDKEDVALSDALLVELMIPDRNYIGTTIEIFYGYLLHKYIVVWTQHALTNPWLRYHADLIVSTLPAACEAIIEHIRG